MTSILLRRAELREIEHRYANLPLMERAGQAAAMRILDLLASRSAPVLVIAGTGNNGGDAFVVARHLHQQQCSVVVVFRGDRNRLPPDAKAACEQWLGTGEKLHAEIPAINYAMVVDGLFGIGLARPVTGADARLIERINQFQGPVLALDVPSGLDADTGQVLGIAVRATHTATFIAAKPGLYTGEGADYAGEISVYDLALTQPLLVQSGDESTPFGLSSPKPVHPSTRSARTDSGSLANGKLVEQSDFAAQLVPRAQSSHKGRYGSLAVVGGAPGMTGAALLAARAGLMLGAGRVFCGLLQPLTVDPLQPELMLRTPLEAIEQATSTVIGPGLGQSASALELMRRVASADFPLLIDADGLNLLAAHPVLSKLVSRRTSATLLTPHPAEAARLLDTDTEEVQADRIAAAWQLAIRFNAMVALKGSGTVIATPDGRWWINTTGNPGLASGGTGDVLAGMTGALLAQGWHPECALIAAVHLNGAAADELAGRGIGPIGLTAGELIPVSRQLLNRWVARRINESAAAPH